MHFGDLGSSFAQLSGAPIDTGAEKGANNMYQNRVTLIGFLGQDAGVHTTKTNQTPYTVLSLATKRSWKDRESGDRMSETTWHKCVAWGKTC